MWKKLFGKKKDASVDYLIVGLGNPGAKYEKTAHNSGFRVVSYLQKNSDVPDFSRDNTLNSYTAKGVIEKKKIALLLPLTFMNLSGGAVKKAVERFNIPLKSLIVVHDDADLPLGTIRFSTSRGSAGHKGVLSIIKALKTKDFIRVRVGVCKEEKEKAINFVLKNLPPKKTEEVEKTAANELKKSLLIGNFRRTVTLDT